MLRISFPFHGYLQCFPYFDVISAILLQKVVTVASYCKFATKIAFIEKKVVFYDTMKHLVKKYLLIVNIKPHSLILILASTIVLTGVA